MRKTTELFLCSVDCPEHQIIFKCYDYLEDEKDFICDPDDVVFASIEIYLNSSCGFFKRIYRGIKYVFGWKSSFGEWISAELDIEKANRLIKAMEDYKGVIEKYEKIRKERHPYLYG